MTTMTAEQAPQKEDLDIEMSPTKLMTNTLETSSKMVKPTEKRTDGVDLVWSNVSMKLMDKKKKGGGDQQPVKLSILEGVWGKAEAGKTTAIMGASGAGKTSLFQTLAGRVSSRGNMVVSGDIYLGGVKFDPSNRQQAKRIAYVAQEDSLHETSTPREALTFSARLRLPSVLSDDAIATAVARTLAELGLESCADTIIGGGFRKGVSGGEKRRVSIGVELVARPEILFLDEPTSGLDSFAAAQVMKLLDRVAMAGNTVLFTIHQPSSNVFGAFDRLILLHKGRVMHQGKVAEVGADFARNGYPVPNNYNPADWVLDVAQGNTIEDLERKGHFFAESEAPPQASMAESGNKSTVLTSSSNMSERSASLWVEFKLLQAREMIDMRRSPASVVINVAITAVLSAIFGVIFLNVGQKDRADFSVIQSQLGATVNILITTLMSQSNPAMITFSKDRPVFLREYSTDHYTIVPYFLSKLWREALNTFVAMITQAVVVYWLMGFQMSFGYFLAITYSLALTATAVATMLGACFDSSDAAIQMFTLVVVPQFYFSGLFIAVDLIPGWVSWGQYLCSMTYASRLAFAYEFGDGCETGAAEANCEAVLTANNVDVDDTWVYWLALLSLFVAFRVLGIMVLRYKARY